MQGWKHWLMGAGFFGFAMFKLFTGGSPWLVGLSVVAAGYLFYRALADQTGAAAEDLELAVGFVRNPYETLFDEAVARLTGEDEEEQPRKPSGPNMLQSLAAELDTRETKTDAGNGFDPDAAIARYLANRPAVESAPIAQQVKGFGRKRA
jgi:hypothetical protein